MRIRHILVTSASGAVLAGTALLVAPGAQAATIATAASATVPAASQFGQHVVDCAQTMGFSAEHNPGMHQGAAGWNDTPCT